MLSRSPEEARIFRVAVASAALGALGALVTVVLATLGVETHVVTDAVRHLMTVGMLTGVVIAMAFRLIVVLEQRALPWPRLRDVALFALVGAVSLRTIEVIVPIVPSIAPVVAVSGLLAWIAVACVGVNLGAAALPRSPAISAGRS